MRTSVIGGITKSGDSMVREGVVLRGCGKVLQMKGSVEGVSDDERYFREKNVGGIADEGEGSGVTTEGKS